MVAVVVVATVGEIADEPGRLLIHLVLLVLLVAGLWVALTRVAAARVIGSAIAVGAGIGIVVVMFGAEGALAVSLAIRVCLLVVVRRTGEVRARNHGALAQGGRCIRHAGGPRGPRRAVHEPEVGRRQGGALHLVDECRRRGIEPVVLEPGQDWFQRVRDAAAGGVDVLGMAGGDGSQAMVATIAAETGLPMVVVPAGTRNHLALDLGLDRDDVVGALDAYGDAVERRLDLADLNGHVFVNNVSLGLYAAIVRSPDYRDAKVDTTLSTLPRVLGPDGQPFDLRFTGPDGTAHDGAHVIQISNNPYSETVGREGEPATPGHAPAGHHLSRAWAGRKRRGVPRRPRVRAPGTVRWLPCVVGADIRGDLGRTDRRRAGRGNAGLGSPAQVLDQTGPGPRAPPRHAPGYSPAARSLGWRGSLRELWGIVLGRSSRFQV